MDIKGHSTMIIAMAIAVVVVTGVMVPVISDALDSAGGGGSGSDNEPYVNSGTAYLKAWDSNEHLITITDSNVNVVFNYDGTDVLTMAKGSEGWSIPLIVSENEDSRGVSTDIACFTYSIADGIGLTNLIDLGIWQDSEGVVGNAWKDQIYASAQDTVFTIEIYEEHDYKYTDFLVNGEPIGDPLPGVTKYLSDNSGEYVYAESPVVADGTEVIQMECYYAYSEAHGSTPSEFTIIEGFSKGDISYLGADYDNYWDIIGIASTSVIVVDGNDYALDAILSCTLSTETLDSGTRIDGMTMETLWYYQSDEFTRTYTFDMYIAPKVVSDSTGSSAKYTIADGTESFNLFLGTDDNGATIKICTGDYDSPTVLYTQDTSKEPIIPIALFEKAVVMSTSNNGYPIMLVYGFIDKSDNGGQEQMLMMSVNTDASDMNALSRPTEYIEIANGTATYYEAGQMSGPDSILAGLTAYLSADGDYILATNGQSSVGSSEFYSITILNWYYDGYTAIGKGTASNHSVDMFLTANYGDNWNNEVTVTEFSIDVTKGAITGATSKGSITYHYGGDDTTYSIDHDFVLGYVPSAYDEVQDMNTPEYAMMCLVPLSENEGGSGDGGGASDSLRAMVSAIPIVMIAGLVIMGVGFMRMGQ